MHVSTANMNFRNYFSACFLLFRGRHKMLVRFFLTFPTSCHSIVISYYPHPPLGQQKYSCLDLKCFMTWSVLGAGDALNMVCIILVLVLSPDLTRLEQSRHAKYVCNSGLGAAAGADTEARYADQHYYTFY